MRHTLVLLLVALLACSALAETRRVRPMRRRALLASGPACEAMPPRGGCTDSVNCGSQCTASTQQYKACCDSMFDLYIVDPSCRDQPVARCDMLYGDDLIDECCKSKAKHQIFDATCPH
ncbi:hypothetical protein COHA_000018 [Chlorella ohadii]|uniref:Uncharacterized protein n=1 Tax=Chlorella ohadii TaxID=2649997 RepID=A0AAD5H9C2_9CHLO|nr:hypothetical protein COHA_000018 [Chlorella ohadii]